MPNKAKAGGTKDGKAISGLRDLLDELVEINALVEQNAVQHYMVSGGTHPLTQETYTQEKIDGILETWGEDLLAAVVRVSANKDVYAEMRSLLAEMEERLNDKEYGK